LEKSGEAIKNGHGDAEADDPLVEPQTAAH
jgi:hypothetical protein